MILLILSDLFRYEYQMAKKATLLIIPSTTLIIMAPVAAGGNPAMKGRTAAMA